MADLSSCLPLTPNSIIQTHSRIKSYIHRTPLLTSHSLDEIASSSNPRAFLSDDPPSIWNNNSKDSSQLTNSEPNSDPVGSIKTPKFNLYLKLESTQRIGAFKARGAFSAVTHLIELLGLPALRRRGVITHSSGNHAQALALAASTYQIPGFIVMPKISTKSKISGTKGFKGIQVVFSGSTAPEREKVVDEVVKREKERTGGEGPILVPPYDHPDVLLGQGTVGLEMEQQLGAVKKMGLGTRCSASVENGARDDPAVPEVRFDAVLTPLGGGGLLSGTATWFSHTSLDGRKKTLVFGTEPSFQGANDGERGLASSPPKRIEHVSSLTIADGVRTPVGVIPWSVISDKNKLEGVYSVSEIEIKMALKLVLERVKLVIEPSSAVPIAVVLFNEKFRGMVAKRQEKEGTGHAWDVGIVISGGNTTVEALSAFFTQSWMEEEKEEGKEEESVFDTQRNTGQIGTDNEKKIQDVAG